jgi:parallel beta-helix repeat protein
MRKRIDSFFVVGMLISCVIAGLFVMNNQVSAEGPTEISGVIDSNATWTLDNSPYIVVENTLVEQQVTLTIQPGVIIKFDQGVYMKIKGNLIADGTESELITFTSNKKSPSLGDWYNLRFESTSKDSKFNYCNIEYSIEGIYGENINLNITNSRFSYNERYAIYLESSNSNISNNIFLNNDQAIWIQTGNSQVNNNYFTKNDDGLIAHESGGEINISNNIFIDNGCGISCTGNSVQIVNNIIENNSYHGISCGSGNPEIINNNVINNGVYGITIWEGSPRIKNNNIYNNDDYNIYCYSYKDPTNATNNWWGTTNTDIINQSIHDYYDDFELGKIMYIPFLTSKAYIVEPNIQPPADIDKNQNFTEEEESTPEYLWFLLILIIVILSTAIFVFLKRRGKKRA